MGCRRCLVTADFVCPVHDKVRGIRRAGCPQPPCPSPVHPAICRTGRVRWVFNGSHAKPFSRAPTPGSPRGGADGHGAGGGGRVRDSGPSDAFAPASPAQGCPADCLFFPRGFWLVGIPCERWRRQRGPRTASGRPSFPRSWTTGSGTSREPPPPLSIPCLGPLVGSFDVNRSLECLWGEL